MNACRSLVIAWFTLTAGLLPALPAAALVIAPDYIVTEIPLSDFAAGDVVVVGDALFVGIGAGFVGGAQSVLRIDAGGSTVIATGFQALGGFAYDAANDRLMVADNGREAFGAVTGDTVFGIPMPLTRATPVTALGSELLPAESIPGVTDIQLDPNDPSGDTLFATDSLTNEVLRVALSAGTIDVLQTTTGFVGGLAASGSTLWFGEVTFGAGVDGVVSSVALPGSGTPTVLASGLPGQYDLELASDGSLLSTSGDALVRIDPVTGETETLATGFGFATGLFESGGTIWLLDGGFPGVASVYQLVPIPEPGTFALLAIGLAALARMPRGTLR